MTPELFVAYALNGPNAGKRLTDSNEIAKALKAPELAWLHLPADHPESRDWLEKHLSYLDPHALDALLATQTRPRVVRFEQGALIILRGVNTNAGQDPDDMVSIRFWIDSARIISLSLRPLETVREIQDRLSKGVGPTDAGAFLCELVDRLGGRIDQFLHDLDDETDALEELVLDGPDPELRRRITETRRQVVAFRRHVGPQRDAMSQLSRTPPEFLTPMRVRQLTEANDRLVRAVEELDAMRERLTVVKDELATALADRLNRNLYMLSIISAVFLPLGFLTGVFGINLAGMPGAEFPAAFWIFCGSLLGIFVLQLLILRKLRWL